MSVVYNKNGEITTNGEQDIIKELTCGKCKNYNESKEYPTIIGVVHVCDKGYICNSWNLTCNCKDFCLDSQGVYKNVNT